MRVCLSLLALLTLLCGSAAAQDLSVPPGDETSPRLAFRLDCRAGCFLALCDIGLAGAQCLRRLDDLGIAFGKAVLLGKALRGSGRRIGAGRIAVPAP